MLNHPLLLAQTANTSPAPNGSGPMAIANESIHRLDLLNHPEELLNALANLHVVWASVFVVLGVLCVLNGYKWHKGVVIICALLAGLGLGNLLSKQMGDSWIVVAVLGLLCAIVAAPMLRFAVAIFGGLTGAFIGANLWTAFTTSPDSHLAGAAMGFIAMGLATFLIFRTVVVTFTSIGGAAMTVLGSITLMMHVPAWKESVHSNLAANHLLIPLLVTAAAIMGIVLQQAKIRKADREEEAAAT